MRIFKIVLLTLLVLLSFGAGIPKIMQMPQELDFLAHLGLSPIAVTSLGVFQFSAGVFLVPSKTRLIGAVLAALALGVSAIALFKGGNMVMGLFTFLPIGIAVVFIINGISKTSSPAERGAA